MLIWLWTLITHQNFDVFLNHYFYFIIFAAFIFSFFITLFLGKKFIQILQQLQMGQVIRTDGPSTHLSKKGTPTMGGVLIIFSIVFTALLLGNIQNSNLYLLLFTLISAGFIGFYDDWKKVILKNPKGLSGRKKMMGLTLISLISTAWLIHLQHSTSSYLSLYIPILHTYLYLGCFFFVFAWLVIVGSSNSVNLTDGLDGLVIFPVILVALGLGLLAYFHQSFTSHLTSFLVTDIPNHSSFANFNLLIFSAAIMGAGLGFLFFNAHPAQIFMGDVGALGLGALLAIMALLLNQSLVFALMGLIFILEALSVMLQVGSYKLRKKRIFKMAPIHHHFELLGWKETQVTTRFWILAVLFLILGLFVGFI